MTAADEPERGTYSYRFVEPEPGCTLVLPIVPPAGRRAELLEHLGYPWPNRAQTISLSTISIGPHEYVAINPKEQAA